MGSKCVKFRVVCSSFVYSFFPFPLLSPLLSSGLVPSNNHYTTDDLFIPLPLFTIIQFFVAGPLHRNTQLYLLETNYQIHTDNAISQTSAKLSIHTASSAILTSIH